VRIRIILAFGVGYVLGTKAGRQRYEQLTRWFEHIADSSMAQAIGDRSRELVGSSTAAARQAAASGLSAAAGQIRKVGR